MPELRDFEEEMARLKDRMNQLFNDYSKGMEQPEPMDEVEWIPGLDVLENKDEIIVKVDLPGMNRDEIDLSISGDILQIKGERKQEIERKDENYHAIERGYGKFNRWVILPVPTKVDDIKASYNNGVLTVRLPKQEKEDTGKIKVTLE